MMDSVSKATLETIGSAGFTVNIHANNLAATNQETNERFIVNYDENFYDAVVELAQQIGLELEDG